jgi:hypothetical protein
MGITAAIIGAVASAGGAAHTISETGNAKRAAKRNDRKQQTLLSEQKAEMENTIKAERASADQTARNAAASRQRALLQAGGSKAGSGGGKNGTLLTGARGLGTSTLLGY